MLFHAIYNAHIKHCTNISYCVHGHSLSTDKNTSTGQRAIVVFLNPNMTSLCFLTTYLHAVVYDGAEIKLHCKEKKTTEGVVAHAVIIDQPVFLELHVYVVSHLERDDHSVAPHVVAIGP